MYFDAQINDGKKIINSISEKLYNKSPRIGEKNVAIISLFRDLLSKAESMNLLICEHKESEMNILLRSFVEEYLYIKFILEKDSVKRGNAYYFSNKVTGLKKVRVYLENANDVETATRLRNSIEKELQKNNHKDVNTLEDEISFYNEKYSTVFFDRSKEKERYYWFNLDNEGLTSIEKLAKHLDGGDIYYLYNIFSAEIHGLNTVKGFTLKSDENNFNLTLTQEFDTNSKAQLLKPFLSRILIEMIRYSKIEKDKGMLGIIMKQQINSESRIRSRR